MCESPKPLLLARSVLNGSHHLLNQEGKNSQWNSETPHPHPHPTPALYTLNLICVLADALWLQTIQFSSLPLHVCKGLLNSLSPRNKPDIPKKRGATFLLKTCFGSCLPRFRRVQEPQRREGDQTEWCSNPWVESVDAALSQCQMKGSFVTVTPAN